MILLSILKILAIILLVVLFTIIVLIFIKIKYKLKIKKLESDIDVIIDYFIFNFNITFDEKKQIVYNLNLLNKIKIATNNENKNKIKNNDSKLLVDSKNDSKNDNKVDNDNLIKRNVKNSKYIVNKDEKIERELLTSALNYDKKIKKTNWKLPSLTEIKNVVETVFDTITQNFRNFNFKKFINRIFSDLSAWLKSVFKINQKKLIKMAIIEYGKNIKYILPRQVKFTTEFGTGNPFTYGLILAIIGPFASKLNDNMKILPNPKKRMLNVDMNCIGTITLKHLVAPALKLLLNKNFRILLKECK